jgi:hypothetical protein
MKLVKYLMPILMAAGFTSAPIFAQQQENAFERQLRENDDQPLREFVQSKENIDIKKKSNNLDISGDIRFEWRSIREKGIALYLDPTNNSQFCENYRSLRGGHHVDGRGVPLSQNDIDVEFNLKLKYSFGRSWAQAHLQFDNPAGLRGKNDCFNSYPIFYRQGSEVLKTPSPSRNMQACGKGSGEANAINLKRAYMGYNLYADGKNRLDVEFGRRKLDDVFDSEVQFSSRFDGVLLKFASAINEVMDWYWEGAAFVVDERVNHFGYVTEIGILNILDTGLDLRYSFIDWRKSGRNRCHLHNSLGNKFANSQFSFAYTIQPEIYCQKIPVEFYGGIVINHAAKAREISRKKKKNLAGYAGVYVGQVKRQGDWSLDIEYIYVQAQAVSDFDVGSIGRGNVLNEDFVEYLPDVIVKSSSESDFSSINNSSSERYYLQRGNANFKGWRFEFLYAITDNFSIDTIYEFSRAEDARIGGRHSYSDFELEVIYAF